MIIAAVKLSDIELDVDAERPNQAKPKRYGVRRARGRWLPSKYTTVIDCSLPIIGRKNDNFHVLSMDRDTK